MIRRPKMPTSRGRVSGTLAPVNLTKARTEAAAVYKERQDTLDAYIRVGAIAFTFLGRVVDGNHGDRVLGAFYGAFGDRTRPIARAPDAAKKVRAAYRRSVVLSIAAVLTDFESACRELIADALEFWPGRFTPALGDVAEPPPRPRPLAKRGWLGPVSEALRGDSAGESFTSRCYAVLGLAPQKGDLDLLPVLDYF